MPRSPRNSSVDFRGKGFPVGQLSRRCHVRAILWRLYPAPFLRDRPPSCSSRFMLISSIAGFFLSRRVSSPRRVSAFVRAVHGMKDNIYVPFMLFGIISRDAVSAQKCTGNPIVGDEPIKRVLASRVFHYPSDPFRMKCQRLKQHWINFRLII